MPCCATSIQTASKITLLDDAVTISTVQNGYSPGKRYIQPKVTVPSGPTNVRLHVVTNSSLGVYWDAPITDGGADVTKYLVEWEQDYTFSRPLYDPAENRGHASTVSYSEVVNATRAFECGSRECTREFADRDPENFDPVDFQYQITGLIAQSYNVRVSAYNMKGYSQAVITTPEVATPSDQLLYKPNHVATYTSFHDGNEGNKRALGDYPNRLEVAWQQPTVDYLGFETITGSIFSPDYASFYHFQWATDENYENVVGEYDMRMVVGDNDRVLCEDRCNTTIGADVQVLKVYSNNGEPLTGGSYKVAYVGPSSPSLEVFPTFGEKIIKVANGTLNGRSQIRSGDLIRIDGDLYEVGIAGKPRSFNITVPFRGKDYDGSSAATAYYVNVPGNCINVSATATNMKAYLTDMIPTGTPYGTEIEVSREEGNITNGDLGATYRITFTGAAFLKNVEKLEVLSRLGGTSGFYASDCARFETGGTVKYEGKGDNLYSVTGSKVTTLASTTVEKSFDAGSIVEGVPYFVRVAAVNNVGLGEYQQATPSRFRAGNALAARAPPGLPTSVKVYAVLDCKSCLYVTWDVVDTDNGGFVDK